MTTVRKGKIRAVDKKSRQVSVTEAADQGGGIEGNMDIDVDIVDVSLVRIVGEMGNACSKRWFFFFLYRDWGAVFNELGNGGDATYRKSGRTNGRRIAPECELL